MKSKNIYLFKKNNDENKKAEGKKKCVIKRELKFQDYKNCLNAAKIDGKLKYLEKKKFSVYQPNKFVKSKSVLKTQQRFKRESHNVFIEVINKIALIKNDDKRMQLIDSTETFGNERRYTTCEKKIKRYKMIQKYLTCITSQKET